MLTNESSFRRCQIGTSNKFLQFSVQLLESPRQARRQSCGGLQSYTGDIENAMLEFGHQIGHPPPVGGENVTMATFQASNQSFQSQPAQVVTHMAGGILVWRESQPGPHCFSEFGMTEAVQGGQETAQARKQCHHTPRLISPSKAGEAIIAPRCCSKKYTRAPE